MKKKKYSLVALLLLGILSFSFGAPYGDLQMVNNTLCDGNGNRVQLKGWSQLDLMQSDTGWVVGSTIPNLKALCPGQNAVRIAMYTSERGSGYMDQNDSGKQTYRQKVKDLINDCINADLYALIDWHILNDTDPWSNEYYDGAREFFEDIAQTYGSYDNVLFELCNEPKQVSFTGTIKPYAEYVLEGIRNYSDNIAVVGTPNWSQDVDQVVGNKITSNVGRGVLYALHFYAGTHYQSYRDKGTTALNGGVPVMLSEWGTVSSSGDGSLDLNNSAAWLDWADQNNLSWFNWSWSIRSETSAAIANGSLSGPWNYPNDLTQSGQWVYDRLSSGTTSPPIQTDPPQDTPVPNDPTPTPGTGEPLDCSNAPTWSASAIYDPAGQRVVYNGNLYENNWYSQDQNPEQNSGANQVWTLIGSCDSSVTPAPTTVPTSAVTNPPQENLGDVNGDGSIDIVDALLIAQYYVGLNPNNFSSGAADVNCSGAIDIVDSLLIAQYYVGLPVDFC